MSPAAYPMVEESDATGLVADTYVRILQRFPMVPSLFKSLAVAPAFLALAWAQTEGVLDDERFLAQAEDLVDAASGVVPAPDGREGAELLSRFVSPLAQMLLGAEGLRQAMAGRLDGPPASVPPVDPSARPVPELEVPPTTELDPELVGRVRGDLATPIVNSVWRYAASRGLLADLWDDLSPHIDVPRFATVSRQVRDRASTNARRIDWPAVGEPATIERHGLTDAAPGIVAMLDAYLVTLPRVLVLVASAREHA